jgi:transcription elongation factor GreA
MGQPKLSEQARASLERRLRELEEGRIERLEREFAEFHDPSIEAALGAAKEEAARLREALASATPLEDEPHDPTVVELGDTVAIRKKGSSSSARFTLVGELEARLDESWVSVASPLGSALLGSKTGDTVEVETPDGIVTYDVLRIDRRT